MRISSYLLPVLTVAAFSAGPVQAQTTGDASVPSSNTGTDSSSTTAPVASSLSTDTPSSGEGGLKQKANGLVVSLGFAAHSPLVQADGNTAFATSSLGGTLFAGYKMDRFIFGLGFLIDHSGARNKLVSPAGESSQTVDYTSFLFTPGVQIAALRAAQGRLELYGSAQFGLGRSFVSRSNNPELPGDVLATYDNSNFRLNYQIGPGLRFYFIPQFALQLTTGVSGDHFFASQDTPSGRRTDNVSNVSIFGNLGLLGVF